MMSPKALFQVLLKLSVSFAIFFLALIPVEIYLRQRPIHISYITSDRFQVSANPRMLYEPSASSGAVNEDGARGPRYAIPKPEGTTRIVVIGDSLAYGYGVRDEETYARRLEALLRDASKARRYEVINLGVEGYRAQQVIARLEEKGMRYAPDVVIYGYWLDDVVNSLSSDQGLFSYESKVALDRAVKRALNRGGWERKARKALLELQIVRRLLLFWRDRSRKEVGDNRLAALSAVHKGFSPALERVVSAYWERCRAGACRDSEDRSIEPYHRYYADPRNLSGLAESLERFSGICREHGAKPVLLMTPVFYDRGEGPYLWKEVHVLIRAIAGEYGIEVIDLEEELARYPYREMATRDHEHPNPRGHQRIAEALFARLKDSHFRLS